MSRDEQSTPAVEHEVGERFAVRPGAIDVNWTGLVEFIEYPFKGVAVMLTWLDTPGNSGPRTVELVDKATDCIEEAPELSNVAVWMVSVFGVDDPLATVTQ